MATSKNLLCPGAAGKGPKRSIPHLSKGKVGSYEILGWPSGDAREELALLALLDKCGGVLLQTGPVVSSPSGFTSYRPCTLMSTTGSLVYLPQHIIPFLGGDTFKQWVCEGFVVQVPIMPHKPLSRCLDSVSFFVVLG